MELSLTEFGVARALIAPSIIHILTALLAILMCLTVSYSGDLPADAPSRIRKDFEVWLRDTRSVLKAQISNPKVTLCAKTYRQGRKTGFTGSMSGTWPWEQTDELAKDTRVRTHGAMLPSVVLGSDKTTVSVATGQNDFYTLYASLGNLQSHTRRSHPNSLAVVGFFAIPKADRNHENTDLFRTFRHQLIHESIKRILLPLKQNSLAGIVTNWCANRYIQGYGNNAKVVWDNFGMISDVLPFTASFPRADIQEPLAPDLLHQVIKGAFKDHIVEWITKYLEEQNSQNKTEQLSELDRRIAAVPPFPDLRRFRQGCHFKQWTGDDSEGLMKVGLVPDTMVKALAAFPDFCYISRQSQITSEDVKELEAAFLKLHQEREVFIKEGPDHGSWVTAGSMFIDQRLNTFAL
ncbi:hypothetical protein NP233_g8222 [Leucocoprinus birnbaumii]|uniref:Uncharacterized protein n=1 Tax=Leucocoprinus birnbaumii TaxID=56174 RepID=A0AAD5VT79_9AGAR|nr:hypothetical protein NP233_g8222 [Leucocoprinus birnbaumii]